VTDASPKPDLPAADLPTPEVKRSEPSSRVTDLAAEPSERRFVQPLIQAGTAILIATTLGRMLMPPAKPPVDPAWNVTLAPLVKQGGDPYIRALMRTISASESNSYRPYSLLYGGEHFSDLSRHPDLCVPILAGPNIGDCTTAAGRYQFITTTWQEQAARYYPQPIRFWESRQFSFAPESQDEVVYRWLSDSTAWGVDLAELLKQDRLTEVLQILSPTWTSLGYGIEPNSMTNQLPEIYQQLLNEELAASSG
jgi:muramidase (phage lysozyme)